MYRLLVTASLLLVAGTSAYMSVYGLMSMFLSHAIVIICMGLGMEIGKVLTVSYLYHRWNNLNRLIRFSYIFIVSILVFITSIEIIGFLSQSHMTGSQGLRITETALRSLEKEAAILKQQIAVIDNTLSGLPVSYVTKRINERKAAGYEKKQARLLEISKIQSQLETKEFTQRQSAGPIFAAASIMKINETNVAAMFILLLVLVLEPLSIGLTLAASAVWLMPKTSSPVKPHKNTPVIKNGPTDQLRSLCDQYNITISQIANITGRKKQKTCEEWIKGTTQVPERALRDVQTWVKKQNLEAPVGRKIITLAEK